MKRTIMVLCLLLCLGLTGCTGKQKEADLWHSAVDSLKQKENYTVEEHITWAGGEETYLSEYAVDISRIAQEDAVMYYERTDGVCRVYVHNEDPDIWVRKEITEAGLYFYDFSLAERLNNLTGYVDMGLLKYDAAEETFRGENIPGAYVYRGEAHRPISLEVHLRDGELTSITETWMGYSDEDGTIPAEKTAVLTVTAVSATEVRLPLDVVDWDESMEESE